MRRFVAWCLAGMVLLSACGASDTVAATSSPEEVSQPTTPPASDASGASSDPSQAVDAPELAGTRWSVTDYSQPDGVITNVWKTEVNISFAADGTVGGSAGCNDFQGTWTVTEPYDEFESGVPDPNDGQELLLESLSWTERACEDEDVMVQEAEILELLQRAGRWVLIRGSFNLRDADGRFLFEAEPA